MEGFEDADLFNDQAYDDLQSAAEAMDIDGAPDPEEALVHALRDLMSHPQVFSRLHFYAISFFTQISSL